MSWFGYIWIVMAAIVYIIWTIAAIYSFIAFRVKKDVTIIQNHEYYQIYTSWFAFTVGLSFFSSLIYWCVH